MGINHVEKLKTPGKKLFKDRLSTLVEQKESFYTLVYFSSMVFSIYIVSISLFGLSSLSLCLLSFHFVSGVLFYRFSL